MNHGVSPTLLEKLKHEIEEFFKLPLEEKMKYKIRPGEVEGYGSVVNTKDQKLDWGDRVYMITNPIHRRKPYLFPELPSSLRYSLSHTLKDLIYIQSFSHIQTLRYPRKVIYNRCMQEFVFACVCIKYTCT